MEMAVTSTIALFKFSSSNTLPVPVVSLIPPSEQLQWPNLSFSNDLKHTDYNAV